jgi:hypothetical protein
MEMRSKFYATFITGFVFASSLLIVRRPHCGPILLLMGGSLKKKNVKN